MQKENNRFIEQYAVMSPRERLSEMGNIYRLLPRAVHTPVVSVELADIQQELAESTRKVDRDKSAVKQIAIEKLSTLLTYSTFTPSGRTYLVTDFDIRYDTGIDIPTDNDENVAASIYGWGQAGEAALFDETLHPTLEYDTYRKVARGHIQTYIAFGSLRAANNSGLFEEVKRDLDRYRQVLKDALGEEMFLKIQETEEVRLIKEKGDKDNEYFAKLVAETIKLRALAQNWRMEIVERDGIEP